MRTTILRLSIGVVVVIFLPVWLAAQEVVTTFGLRHTALSNSLVQVDGGGLLAKPASGWGDDEEEFPVFGVAVDLGEADAGILGQLDFNSSLQSDGNYMVGRVYGRLNSITNQFVSSLEVKTVSAYGRYDVSADFSALGAATVGYFIYDQGNLVAVASNAVAPVAIMSSSDATPSANPFYRLPDGGVAALVQLSYSQLIELPGWNIWRANGITEIRGDQVIIRPEGVTSFVDYVSRVEVQAGGGESYLRINQEHLGVFGRPHKMIGDGLLVAANGRLRVQSLDPEASTNEFGVAIRLDSARHFAVDLEPVALETNGAVILANAIVGVLRAGGESPGFARVENVQGVLQAVADFSNIDDTLQVGVYRAGCAVGFMPAEAHAVVRMAGLPQVVGVDFIAPTALARHGYLFRLDRVTSFTLPDGSVLEGDQVGFQTASPVAKGSLLTVNLAWSKLPALTIVGETGLQTFSVEDFFVDAVAPAFLKEFQGEQGDIIGFHRKGTQVREANILRNQWVDVAGNEQIGTTEFSYRPDGLYFHGETAGTVELSGSGGLRLLPSVIALGQSYVGQGTFIWRTSETQSPLQVEVTAETKVAAYELKEMSALPGSLRPVLRLETRFTFNPATPGQVPEVRTWTNWVAQGMGVVRFVECDSVLGNTVCLRGGELTAVNLLKTPPAAHAVNVAANVEFIVDVVATPGVASFEWLQDNAALEIRDTSLVLNNVQPSMAGQYSLKMTLPTDDVGESIKSPVASLQVVPFNDTLPFWAASVGGSYDVNIQSCVSDASRNVYVAGRFRGELRFGTNQIASYGGDDVFVVKLDSNGQILWARTAGGTRDDYVGGLGVDAQGNVFFAGFYRESAVFGSTNLNSGTWDARMFVAKYGGSGNFLWVFEGEGNSVSFAQNLVVTPEGAACVVGSYSQGWFKLGNTTFTNTAWNSQGVLFRLDAGGQVLWAQGISATYNGEPGMISATALALSNTGDLVLGGYSAGDATFGTIQLGVGASYQQGFIAVTDAAGQFRWAKRLGRDVQALDVDSMGNIYASGLYDFQFTFEEWRSASGLYAGNFLAKLLPDGKGAWARTDLLPYNYQGSLLTIDREDNIYLAGSAFGRTTLGGTTYVSPFSSRSLVMKQTSAGERIGVKHFGGEGENWPQALTSDTLGNVYLAGLFRSELNLGDTNLTDRYIRNAFVVELTGASPPIITQQPLPQTIQMGQTATFTVVATGTAPLRYQWRKDGQELPEAYGNSLTISNAQPADAGGYSVVVRNGGGLTRSIAAALTFPAQTGGNVAFRESQVTGWETNGVVQIEVVRTGDTNTLASVDYATSGGTASPGLDYYSTAGTLLFAPGEITRTAAITLVNDSEAEPDETISVQLCNPVGVTIGTPSVCTLLVRDSDVPGTPMIRLQPASQTVAFGAPVTLGVVAEGTEPMSYQWRKNQADIAGATNRLLVIDIAQLNDAGDYSVIVRNAAGETISFVARLEINMDPSHDLVIFGLTNRLLGPTVVTLDQGDLRLTPGFDLSEGSTMAKGYFGVSILLGEADSGVFGYLNTSGSFQGYDNFTLGQVYGRLNGVPDQFVCSLLARTIDSNGRYQIEPDFRPLGATRYTCEIFQANRLVERVPHLASPIVLNDFNELSPRANPFQRLPDGSIAAVIEFSSVRGIEVPAAESEFVGDRLVLRPENVSVMVDFVSRVDVTAGGGETMIHITDERLGMFGHRHKALGEVAFNAVGGHLNVDRLNSTNLTSEIGVSIGLESARQFAVELQPVALPPGAMLSGSVLGNSGNNAGGEFLGQIQVKNQDGVVQAIAEFPGLGEEYEIQVYRLQCLVGGTLASAQSHVIGLSDTPIVKGFTAGADAQITGAWVALQLDRSITFTLPGGATLEGDELRFRAVNAAGLDRLTALSLTSTGLASFTILNEGEPQIILLADYFSDLTATAVLKRFVAASETWPSDFARFSTRTNLGGSTAVVVNDQYDTNTIVSSTYAWTVDGVRWYGDRRPGYSLMSDGGLDLLPSIVSVGHAYVGQGTFAWQESAATPATSVEVRTLTRVAGLESLVLATGSYDVLRLESVITLAGELGSRAPVARYSTNWLAAGLGVVRFVEIDVFANGDTLHRSGEVTDYGLITAPARTHTVNVGAHIALDTGLVGSPAARLITWNRDGEAVALAGAGVTGLDLPNIQKTDAGFYSVDLVIGPENSPFASLTSPVAEVQVLPFSDPAASWVTAFYSSINSIHLGGSAVDGNGNLYLGGNFNGEMTAGTNQLVGNMAGYNSFLIRLDAAGHASWLMPGPLGVVYDTRVDAAGNAYVLGHIGFSDTLSSFPLERGLFVAKANANGQWQWAASIAGERVQFPARLALDSAGNTYVAGAFEGILDCGGYSLSNSYTHELFLIKLSPAGQCLMARQSAVLDAYDGRVDPCAVVVDENAAALYLVGVFFKEFQFGNVVVQGPMNRRAGFLMKADLQGNVQWTKPLPAVPRNAALDRTGYLVVVSEPAESYGGSTLSLSRFTSQGALLWTRNTEQKIAYEIEPLAVDSYNNINLAGSFYEQAVYRGTLFRSPDFTSTVLTKFSSKGHFLVHKHVSGSGPNYPMALAADSSGNVFLSGALAYNAQFGAMLLTSTNYYNAFVVKLGGEVPPGITRQPVAQTVDVGQPVTFSVQAAGTEPLLFQWRKDDRNLVGATGSVYQITHAVAADQGQYHVVVKNSAGVVESERVSLAVRSSALSQVSFAVNAYDLIETNGLAWITLNRGGNTGTVALVEFKTVEGTARAGLDYVPVSAQVLFQPGETAKQVFVPVINDTVNEASETVLLRLCHPSAGTEIVSLDTATLTILDEDMPGLPIILRQPASMRVTAGDFVRLNVMAEGPGLLQYQWHKNGLPISGATFATLTFPQTTPADAGVYSVVIRSSAGEVTSADARLDVMPWPVILSPPMAQEIPVGEPFILSVVATSALPVISQVYSQASAVPMPDWFNFPTAGNGTLRISYDLGSAPDNLQVYAMSETEGLVLLGSVITNGVGVLAVSFGTFPAEQLAIAVSLPSNVPGDGWAYRAEVISTPLHYQWYLYGSKLWGMNSATLIYPEMRQEYAGDYRVAVTDAAGTVTSNPVTVTMTGPRLRLERVAAQPGQVPELVLQWNAQQYTLQKRTTLTEPWEDVPNAFPGMVLLNEGPQVFYRLRGN